MMRRLLPLVALVASCDFFADEGFPCANDGSCPGGLFCVDDVCVKDAPGPGREGEGEEGEGEEGEGEEGEGEEGEGEEGEGEGPGGGFVFARTVIDLPSNNVFVVAARGPRVVIAGVSSDAVLGEPAVSPQERFFVATADDGAPAVLAGSAIVDQFKARVDDVDIDDNFDAIVSGFVAGLNVAVDTDFSGGCHLADAGRISVFSLRIDDANDCDVPGRITAAGNTPVNIARAVPYRAAGSFELFGIQVSTSDGATFDMEAPTTRALNALDYGSMWVSTVDRTNFFSGEAESFFIAAADAPSATVIGTSLLLDGEPVSFQGATRSTSNDENGLIGFAQTPARSTLFASTDKTTAERVAHIGSDPVVVGAVFGAAGDASCEGVFVSRLRSDLQGAVWTAELCTDNPQRIHSVDVQDGEVLVFFTTQGFVSEPDGPILVGSGGPIAAAFDADDGSLNALANAFAEGIDDAVPAEPAFGAVSLACGDNQEFACAVSAHRRR